VVSDADDIEILADREITVSMPDAIRMEIVWDSSRYRAGI
jgi:hypothetical protein